MANNAKSLHTWSLIMLFWVDPEGSFVMHSAPLLYAPPPSPPHPHARRHSAPTQGIDMALVYDDVCA